MPESKPQIIKKTAVYIKHTFGGEASGHDWWHIYRVWQTARKIAKSERADGFVVELAALLHDLGDYKLEPDRKDRQAEKTGAWLKKAGVSRTDTDHVLHIVTHMSFSKNVMNTQKLSLEGRIVQDADRLDAIGAIGVMRTFVYAGANDILPYVPGIKPRTFKTESAFRIHEASAVNHFYEKLLLLKNKMNTKTARKMAIRRHKYMEHFLKEFYSEWEGN